LADAVGEHHWPFPAAHCLDCCDLWLRTEDHGGGNPALDDGTWIAWMDMSFEPAARFSGDRRPPDPE
jgi:hypothetical protein